MNFDDFITRANSGTERKRYLRFDLFCVRLGLGHGGYLGPADMTLAGHGDLIKSDPSLLRSNDDSLLGPPDEDDIPSPTNHIPKGPSPEPKIEDSECHRSQSAM